MVVSKQLLRVPEVARALGIDGTQVYSLIDHGELKAGEGPDGLVYVSEDAIEDYRRKPSTASR